MADDFIADEDMQVRNMEAEAVLKAIGETLRRVCPAGYGFSFLLWEFGAKGNVFYTSNCRREDVVKGMLEFIEKVRSK